jgi:hypothetical protein
MFMLRFSATAEPHTPLPTPMKQCSVGAPMNGPRRSTSSGNSS